MVDEKIINILVDYIDNDKKKEPEYEDAYSVGINTVKGEAIRNLTRIGSISKYSNTIFPLLIKYAQCASISFRVCLIHELVYLMRIDKGKTLDIYLELIKDKNEEVIVSGMNCAQYLFMDYFPALVPYIQVLMKTNVLYFSNNTQHFLAQILLMAMFENVEKSETVFEELLFSSNLAKAGAVNCAIRHLHYKDKHIRNLCLEIFIRFLNENDEAIAREYEYGFNDITPDIFNDVYPALIAFSKSKVSLIAANRLYEYLTKVVIDHPEECLELLRNFSYMELPDVQYNAIGPTPLEILVQAYNQVRKYDKDNPLLESAIDTFDKMLSHPAFKPYAWEILKLVDN